MGYACGGNRTSGFLWQEGLAVTATGECIEDRASRVWPHATLNLGRNRHTSWAASSIRASVEHHLLCFAFPLMYVKM